MALALTLLHPALALALMLLALLTSLKKSKSTGRKNSSEAKIKSPLNHRS
jgi:hypothetical protein